MPTDPVCLMVLDEENVKCTTTYKNETYYFCCDYCRRQFEANPKKYSRFSLDVSVDLAPLQ